MKHTLKTLELLEEHIDLLAENGIYEIERDLLLERLRGLYASVVALEAKAEEERVLDALMGLGVVAEAAAEEPEIEVERICAEPEEEPEAQVVEEPAAPEEPEAEVEPEVEEEIAPEEPEESVIELIEELVEEVEEFANEEEPELEEPDFEEKAEVEAAPVGANRFIGAIEEPTAPEEPEPAFEEVEPEVEPEVAPAPEVEEMVEPEIEEESEPAFEPESEVIPVPEQIDHKAALSLYDDEDDDEEPEAEVAPEEQIVEEEPEEEPAEEVEESTEEPAEESAIPVEKVTLAELLAAENTVDVATAASSTLSLRQSIGINDKYILMRDLFAGDADYYESAISALDEFDNLDEAMLYIHDNFRWSPNSEGARLLMELLACKLI